MQGKGEGGPVAGNVVQGLESELCRRTQRAPFSPYHKEKMRSKAARRVSELGEGWSWRGGSHLLPPCPAGKRKSFLSALHTPSPHTSTTDLQQKGKILDFCGFYCGKNM